MHNNAYASQKKPSRDAEKDTRTQKTGFSDSHVRLWHTAGWFFAHSNGVFPALPNGLFHLAEEAFRHHRKGSPAHPKRLFRTRKKCPPRSGNEKQENQPPHYACAGHIPACSGSGGIHAAYLLCPLSPRAVSCINIHKKPTQQAACHRSAHTIPHRRPPSSDIREA